MLHQNSAIPSETRGVNDYGQINLILGVNLLNDLLDDNILGVWSILRSHHVGFLVTGFLPILGLLL